MSGILRDIRYSARSLARNPGLTLALLFTIALGIGSNVTVRGFVRGLTTRSFPIKAADGVVSLFERDAHGGSGLVSCEDYRSLRSNLDSFRWIGAARISRTVVTLGGRSPILSVAAATPELASLFNLPLDDGVVVSHRVWEGELGGKPDLRGERVRIGNIDARVAGVAPDWLTGVYGDRPVDLWMPLADGSPGGRKNFWVLAGLRPGVSAGQVKAAVRANRVGSTEIGILPYTGMSPEMASSLLRVGTLLQVAAGLVFFIACANVASFLFGRAAARSRETSICIALGAGRSRLARAVLWDSVLICLAGGALGALLALWTSRAIPAFLFQQDAEILALAPDVFSIVVASAAGAGIIIACGLVPLFDTPYDRPAAVLHREGVGPSKATRAVREGLVVAQMACCCLLVSSTGFLYQSLHAALETSVSRRLGQPVLATVQAHPDVGIQYFRDVERAARSVAGVSGMAWAAHLPGQPAWQSFRVEPRRSPVREVELDVSAFTSDSLPLFTLPPRAGRLFGYGDRACGVAIVNEEAAEILFGDETVGRSVRDPAGMPIEIIGVVALRKKGPSSRRRRPTIYYDYTDRPGTRSGGTGLAGFRAPVASRLDSIELDINVVSPGYFAAMGLPLVAGRVFPDGPYGRACRVGVINQEAADLYFGGNGLGAAVIDEAGLQTTIIGVVRSAPLGTFQRCAEPAIYFPMEQDCPRRMTLILGARKASDPMLAEVRRTLELVPGRGPAPPVVKTLQTYLRQTALAPLRIATTIIGTSAATALLLSVLGLHGALSDAARRRGRELAVRIALGARRRHVIGQALREGGPLAGAGTLIGVLGSLPLAQMLSRIAPGIGSPKLWVWTAGPLVVAGAVVIASVLPARRALMVDPLNIMRDNT